MGIIKTIFGEPDYSQDKSIMEFRLTYAGQLKGASSSDTRAAHKHEIRKVFHKQLKRLWEIDPFLKEAKAALDNRMNEYQPCGFKFVPLITEPDALICDVKLLFIRPDLPGKLIRSGDLDNRLKTIFDALRLPMTKGEMGGYEPDADEIPFFCLLADDRLITHVSIETDVLLEPIAEEINENDVRLIVHVDIRPYKLSVDNIDFI